MRNSEYLPVYIGGMLSGIVVAGLIWVLAKFQIPTDPGGAVKEWGTTVGVYLALLTYLSTLLAGWLKHIRQRRINLATLGVDLSAICAYAEECMELAYKMYQAILAEKEWEEYPGSPGYTPAKHFALEDRAKDARKEVRDWFDSKGIPSVEQQAIERIANGAGSIADKRLADLLNTYQVQRARLSDDVRGFLFGHPNPSYISFVGWHRPLGRIKDAARLAELASQLFDLPRKGWNFNDTNASEDQIDARASMTIGITPSEEMLKRLSQKI